MTAQILTFLVLGGLALLAWAAFRSRWYREALEDLAGMRRASGREAASGLHALDPIHQVTRADDRSRRADR